MDWISAAITAAAQLGSASINSKNGGKAAATPGLSSSLWSVDASMNNGAYVVTTGGSVAEVSATTSRTTSPSAELSTGLGGMLPGSGGQGLDMWSLLAIGALIWSLAK